MTKGFIVIFNKARHKKKTKVTTAVKIISLKTTTEKIECVNNLCLYPPKSKWLCCIQV
ncbi:hypothetical protein DITRI_Ditri19aG0123500 [Diplodiscus trichospermus]